MRSPIRIKINQSRKGEQGNKKAICHYNSKDKQSTSPELPSLQLPSLERNEELKLGADMDNLSIDQS